MSSLPSSLAKKKGKTKLHPCHLCSSVFPRPHRLVRHIQISHEGYRYQCFHCGIMLQAQLKRHLFERCAFLPPLERNQLLVDKDYERHFNYHLPLPDSSPAKTGKWNINTNAPTQCVPESQSTASTDVAGNLIMFVDPSGRFTYALIRDLAADPTLINIDMRTGLLSTTHSDQVIYSPDGSVASTRSTSGSTDVKSIQSLSPVKLESSIHQSPAHSVAQTAAQVIVHSAASSIADSSQNVVCAEFPFDSQGLNPLSSLIDGVSHTSLGDITIQSVIDAAMDTDFFRDFNYDDFNVDDILSPPLTSYDNVDAFSTHPIDPAATCVDMPTLGSPRSSIPSTVSSHQSNEACQALPDALTETLDVKKRKRAKKSRVCVIIDHHDQSTSVYSCPCGTVPLFEDYSLYVLHLLDVHQFVPAVISKPFPIEPGSVVVCSSFSSSSFEGLPVSIQEDTTNASPAVLNDPVKDIGENLSHASIVSDPNESVIPPTNVAVHEKCESTKKALIVPQIDVDSPVIEDRAASVHNDPLLIDTSFISKRTETMDTDENANTTDIVENTLSTSHTIAT